MKSADLKTSLDALGLSQADLARLVDVTPRAVTLWVTDQRSIPGSVEAYVRLLQQCPLSLRQAELSRIRQKGLTMRDGMYGIEFAAAGGSGKGALVMQNGRVFGADEGGGKYDGEYEFDPATGLAALRIKVTMPPGGYSVLGIQHPYEWSLDLTASLDPRVDQGQVRVVSKEVGQSVDATYRYLRPLPDA